MGHKEGVLGDQSPTSCESIIFVWTMYRSRILAGGRTAMRKVVAVSNGAVGSTVMSCALIVVARKSTTPEYKRV